MNLSFELLKKKIFKNIVTANLGVGGQVVFGIEGGATVDTLTNV